MNTLGIVVAILAAMLGGIGLCLLAVFCVVMLRMMQSLELSAKEVVSASKESLAEARAVVAQVKDVAERNFGENSPTARASRAVSALANNLPQITAGMDAFSKTMQVFYKTAFDEKQVERVTTVAAPPAGEFTGQISYSEEDAAQYEQQRRAERERVVLSREEMAGMRTDKVEEVPEVETSDLKESAS